MPPGPLVQDDVVPKEKHVRTLKIGCSGSQPRQQVGSPLPLSHAMPGP